MTIEIQLENELTRFCRLLEKQGICATIDLELSAIATEYLGIEKTRIAQTTNPPGDVDAFRITKPVTCGHLQAGNLVLLSDEKSLNEESISAIPESVGRIIQSHIVDNSIAGGDLFNNFWIGDSQALRQVETLIGKFSRVDLPVMIHGERGTGKLVAAYSIHCFSHRYKLPFVQECCLQWNENNATDNAEAAIKKAAGGTLFLRNINVLSNISCNRIAHLWEREYIDVQTPTRIIVSTSPQFETSTIEQSSAPWLSLRLPTLEQRRRDIPILTRHFLEKYSQIKCIKLDKNCFPILENRKWANNVRSLDRLIANICVKSDETTVNAEILSQFLCIESEQEAGSTVKPVIPDKHPEKHAIQDEQVAMLARQILAGDLLDSITRHPAIARATACIRRSFNGKVSLEDAAIASHVSATHLSYLFRTQVGVPFKKLVVQVRIEHAAQLLLRDKDKSVTLISTETGFHDLSHFEKTFKKLKGTTPLKYRSKKIMQKHQQL